MGDSDWLLWAILVVANIPLYILLGSLFYGSWERYKELWWALRDTGGMGEWKWPWEGWGLAWETWTEHTWEAIRFLLYVACCVLLVIGEYLLIRRLWPRPDPWDILKSLHG
ncbi:MAG: hypothetical protein FJ290_18835 [Planctomycetes bacterium]|nr:hypothetical protein [Planctomycetota bacterium]